jgi:tight adherence protein B
VGRDAAAALRALAVVCDVVDVTGAPAADVLSRYAAGLRADVAAADDLATAMAGPRASAAVLTALPAFGAAVAATLGINTLGTLVGTAPGRLCLVTGLVLWGAGSWWSRTVVRRCLRR